MKVLSVKEMVYKCKEQWGQFPSNDNMDLIRIVSISVVFNYLRYDKNPFCRFFIYYNI